MYRVRVLAGLMLIAHIAGAAEAEIDHSGIWRDESKASRYFTIHERDGELVFIALDGIAQSGKVLRFSYRGNADDLFLTRISRNDGETDIYQYLKLEFSSPDKGVVYPLCEVCSAVPLSIRRVF